MLDNVEAKLDDDGKMVVVSWSDVDIKSIMSTRNHRVGSIGEPVRAHHFVNDPCQK